MPEPPFPKARPHPKDVNHHPSLRLIAPAAAYAELQVTSNFTFLTGASHPDELVQQAALLGYAGIAITDRNSLAGIVRAHVAAKEIGIPLAVGCRLDLMDSFGWSLLVYPTDRAAYGRLCRLLTLGKRRAPKGECRLTLHDVLEHQQGLLAVALPPSPPSPRTTITQDCIDALHGLRRVFDDDRLSLAVGRWHRQDDDQHLHQMLALGEHVRVPVVATNDVHYHVPERRALQDVLTCIRHGCTIEQAGFRLFENAERHLKPPEVMAELFRICPSAIDRTATILQRASAFSLDELRYEYPEEVVPTGFTPMQHLIGLTRKGAAEQYPQGVPSKVRSLIEHEFKLIEELHYAPYFLTVHDLVRFARGKGILCQGRGAAANSAVCYCLGVTAVDPDRVDMLFERFVSKERNEPPDIDIDFEHERREEVIQYIYGKYGRERAALTAEVISYRGRSAVRDVGKALGLSLDLVDKLAKDMDWWSDVVKDGERLRGFGLDPSDPTVHWLVRLASEIQGFPRHLSQHVGGFVITRGPLCEMVPIENAAMEERTVIEWDKDDVDAMGMMKVDVLGLGMLTCLRKALEMVNEHRPEPVTALTVPPIQTSAPSAASCQTRSRSFGRFDASQNLVLAALVDPHATPVVVDGPPPSTSPAAAIKPHSHRWPLELHNIPAEDPSVYDMICNADTIGVFQIESRAQMSMLPRLRPRCYYDLVIEVAIVRPGPIQGNMVHPYLRRRNGEERPTYPDDTVKAVLQRTLGVPLFQEQAMQLAIVAAGFTAGEADQLRRAIAAWKTRGNKIAVFGERIIKGMTGKGYSLEFARQCFEQIKGFSGYGFPESHAASFALLVYSSSWLKRYHPAAFAAALLNSQPMGFYAPAQIVRDAQEHGVMVRAVDVNHSRWDCTLEDQGRSLRLGLRLVRGLSQPDAESVVLARKQFGIFTSINAVYRRSGVRTASLRKLARADAFASMGFDRQSALWAVQALRDESLPLFDSVYPDAADAERSSPSLPSVSGLRNVARDYDAAGLSLRAHPVSFLRKRLDSLGVTANVQLKDAGRWPQGKRIAVSGIVLVRQRPSTANGIVFMTIEDEGGVANLIIRPQVYQRFRKAARHSVIILARGMVERQGAVVHVLVSRIEAVPVEEEPLEVRSRDFH